jgi:hypothetical protein
MVLFGNQVTIGCSVSSNPPHTRVFWRKKRNGITTDLNVANSNDIHNVCGKRKAVLIHAY